MLTDTETKDRYVAVPIEFTVRSTALVKNVEDIEDAITIIEKLRNGLMLPRIITQKGECRIITDEESIKNAQNEINHGLLIESDENAIWADVTIL